MPVWFLSILLLIVWEEMPWAFAQPQPSVGLQFSSGQATLSLTGAVGTVYSIQYTSGLSSTNLWVDRTLLLAQPASNVWTDPTAPSTAQRFYRAVSVAAPADTNLVFIQPGTFTMGSPTNESGHVFKETQHLVTISRGFWMGKYLVTQGDYLAVTGIHQSYFTSAKGYSDDPTRPVETTSWSGATNYCALRTRQERAAGLVSTNCVYRLPTESEWEFACRAATTTAFYLGDSIQSGQANFDGRHEYDAVLGTISNPSGIFLGMTSPVGIYAPNPWGLYDMIGDVWEWCRDWYGNYPGGSVIDPQGPDSGSFRVLRGGGWDYYATNCRAAKRFSILPEEGDFDIGFRVVLAQGEP